MAAVNLAQQLQQLLENNDASVNAARARSRLIRACLRNIPAMDNEDRMAAARLLNSRAVHWTRVEPAPHLHPLPLPDGQQLPHNANFPGTREELFSMNMQRTKALLHAYNQPDDGNASEVKARFLAFIATVDQ